ncbi:MAG: hypothetical protein IPM63_03515 [Acidobacteriota bacterium]|nr:MAG: hypothetical protein IPM63_03515 [Acidobacteriota bacterium]
MKEIKELLRPLPLIRSKGKTTPVYHLGGIWENRLGLQVGRVLLKNLFWQLRRRNGDESVAEYVETLHRDGVLAIEDFLSEADFASVVEEYRSAMSKVTPKPYKGLENAKLFRTQIPVSDDISQFPNINRLFRQNRFLRDIAAGAIRRNIVQDPTVFLDKYVCLNPLGVENDIENILHADLHTPTVKMFFYLNQVNEENGAFVYAKRSHTLNFNRLRHEYELSVRQARMRKGLPISEDLIESRGAETRNVISPEHYRLMDVDETQFCVRPNTLLIANNMGFHRRGEFNCSTPREALLISFRNSERIFF